MSRYARLFSALKDRDEGAFIPFVALGDPTPDLSAKILDALVAGGADALELGIPFSDPVADGPTIQLAAQRALAAGVTPPDCWRLLTAFRARHPDVPVGLLVYANLVHNEGLEAFYGHAQAAGVDSVLVADVPTLEGGPWAEAAAQHHVEPVFILPPNADDACLTRVAALSRGYTYVVTRAGVTGADEEVRLSHAAKLTRLAELGGAPPVLGFGISRPEHVRHALAAGAAGAISGSAVVKHIERRGDDPAGLLEALEAFVARMKAATRGASV